MRQTDGAQTLQLPDGLIERIQAGDRAALDILYRAYYAGLLDFAYRFLRSRDVAHDIVQDVFVSIWMRRSQWVVRGSIASYLYQAVRNHAIHYLEHRQVESRVVAMNEPVAMGHVPGVEDSVGDGQQNAELARAIDALPERQRSAVLLHYGKGISIAEVGRVLEISHTAATNLLNRAVLQLREVFRVDL